MVSGKAASRSQGIPTSPTHGLSLAVRPPDPKESLRDTAWKSSSRPIQLTLILQSGFCERWLCFPVKCILGWGYFPGVGSAKLRVQNGARTATRLRDKPPGLAPLGLKVGKEAGVGICLARQQHLAVLRDLPLQELLEIGTCECKMDTPTGQPARLSPGATWW